MTLPMPENQFFKEYKRIVMQFLWDNKISHIRYSEIIQSFEQGGLQLMDLPAKNHALKASWLAKWTRNGTLEDKQWLYINLPIQDKRIWEIDISPKHLLDRMGTSLDMSTQILISMASIYFPKDFTPQYAMNTPIWGNSNIVRVNSPFWDTALLNSNINTFTDVYDCLEKWYCTFKKLEETHGITVDYLTYRAIVTAIPKMWKFQAHDFSFDEEAVNTTLKTLPQTKTPSKTLYWNYIEKHFPHHDICRELWQSDLAINIDEEEWHAMYRNIMKLTVSSKLRYIQYRILNRTLTTNIRRNKWDLDIFPKCRFCRNAPELVTHLLFQCPETNRLWTSLSKWLKYFYEIPCQFDQQMVILNNYKGKHKNFVNICILIMKQFIYAQKCKQEKPLYTNFVSRLDY